MLFNEEIAGLHEDGFEGSISESRIFTEVFLQNSNKRCLVTGVINFECCHSKRTDMSFSSKSENSAMTSQLDSCNVKRDSRENSALGCFPDGCDLLMRGDCDANRKRMRLSIDKHSYSRPFSRPVFNSSAPSKGVSGMYQPASQSVGHTVTCRLVESSSHGVSSSCYMLKRHAETNSRGEPGHRNVSKSRLQSLDGNDEKEVNASKAIASPVSQESSATKLLITSPLVTIVSRSRSHRHAEEIMRRSNHVGLPDELPEAKITPNKDSMKDPRPLLRYHIQNLLRAAGWEIGRRKRENISGEFLYFSPWGGRPIREFRRVWNSCGQSLFSDGNIVVQEDSKKWTDMSHFWYDLSNTFIKIEEELSHTETTSALAHWWYLLDPFANMVFIDKKLGTLRAGKAIKARRSLVIDTTTKHDAVLDLKNVDAIGNRSKRYSKDRLCGSSVTRESSSTVSAGIYCFCKERCGTRDHSSGCLFEVPVASENANIMLGGSDAFLPHQDCNTNSPSCDRHGFGHCKVMASEVKQNVLVSFCGDKIFSKKVENQLKDSLDDHLNCRSDDLTQSDHPGRTYGLSNTRRVIVPHKELFLENSHLGDVNGEEVLQYYGGIQNEGDQCIEASKFKMSGASSVASATTRKKARNKSKWSFHKKDRLGLSSSYKIERHDINRDNVPLESVGVDESFIAIDGKTDKNCKYSFSCSFQHKDGKKPLRFRKFHKNSGIPKKSNQFSYEEFKFENITDECPLHIMNESLYPEAWRQEVKSEKPETQNTCVQKRSITCCLKDDDLLISAFIKNKSNGSTNKQSTQKMKSCKSDVPRKRKSEKGSCRLLPRSLGKGGKHIEGKWSIFGVRTVLSWLIHSGVVSLNEVIQFRNSKDDAVIKDGLVTRDGILCRCCNMNFSVSEFKIHAGFKLKRPCLNLFMESGKPFTLCQLEAWSAEYKARKTATRPVHGEVMDQNDDSCGLCGDGGELICCDNCPSTFHQACLYAQELPEGSWYCPYCTCHICGGGGDGHREPSKSPGALKCSQCEHTYHEACLKGKGTCGEVASDAWFCSESCQEIYLGLHSNIGVLNLLSDGFSWTLLRCIHGDQRVHSAQRFVALKAECNSKLAVALTIMEECFLSMVDSRTGIDMIPHVLYNWGSQFARLNYNGFHAVLLEKNDVLMSVASIRIHGVTVAEVPLIATCSKYRRQGMCRRLMNTIEEMLKAFKVEKLVMSAIPSLVETWTVGFGFEPMEDNERKSLSDFNLMVFPGTVWLKKPIYDKEATNQQGSGHASSLIGYDPPEPGACFKGGPIVESTKQADGSSSVKEVGILTEIGHTDCKNPRAEEDRNGISQKHFPKLSCEKWASDGRESPLEMVCLVESRVKHDERELYFNEQSQKDHILQDNER